MTKLMSILLLICFCAIAHAQSETEIENSKKWLTIMFSDAPIPKKVAGCFEQIPPAIRKSCHDTAVNRYLLGFNQMKSRCCTKWFQLECLQKYAELGYCNAEKQNALKGFYDQLRTLKEDGALDCELFRPLREDKNSRCAQTL